MTHPDKTSGPIRAFSELREGDPEWVQVFEAEDGERVEFCMVTHRGPIDWAVEAAGGDGRMSVWVDADGNDGGPLLGGPYFTATSATGISDATEKNFPGRPPTSEDK